MIVDLEFDAWWKNKRALSSDEVLNGVWVKVSAQGRYFSVHFHQDNTLTEIDLQNLNKTWQGTWRICSGILCINIGNYELNVLANQGSETHSGIEINPVLPGPPTYFKVIHIVQSLE